MQFNLSQEERCYRPIKKHIDEKHPKFANKDTSFLPSCEILNCQFKNSNSKGVPLKFIEQNQNLPFPELGYEQRIYQHGLIATRRHSWHDFFNAMVWQEFPQTKSAINTIHNQEISLQKSATRSRKRDLLTLFDESGVIVMADNKVLESIIQHDWLQVFVKNRENWLNGSIQVVTFGHALYEKYLNPYIGLTAQALLLESSVDNLDEMLSEQLLNDNILQTKNDLSPLPLLGIPNWCSRQDDEFYQNKTYFR